MYVLYGVSLLNSVYINRISHLMVVITSHPNAMNMETIVLRMNKYDILFPCYTSGINNKDLIYSNIFAKIILTFPKLTTHNNFSISYCTR